jgi:hypothetical protein
MSPTPFPILYFSYTSRIRQDFLVLYSYILFTMNGAEVGI